MKGNHNVKDLSGQEKQIIRNEIRYERFGDFIAASDSRWLASELQRGVGLPMRR